jgi:hypothetical protein
MKRLSLVAASAAVAALFAGAQLQAQPVASHTVPTAQQDTTHKAASHKKGAKSAAKTASSSSVKPQGTAATTGKKTSHKGGKKSTAKKDSTSRK